MPTMYAGFHAHDGWYFERLSDGSVKINAAVSRCTEEITLSPGTWASAVASMTAEGETSQSYYRALAAQQGTDQGAPTEPNLGLATTQELITELAARADVAATIGEQWPAYRTAGNAGSEETQD